MQENNGGALTLVMIGDLDSVKGCESVHSAPLNGEGYYTRSVLQAPVLGAFSAGIL
jgi:hypothetical protein